MDTLNLASLIGKEILDLRFHYVAKNEWDLQSFNAYLKLTGDIIIGIPRSGDVDGLELTQDNLDYLRRRFDTGQAVKNKNTKALYFGQRITNFYFTYYNNEIEFEPAFIELSNGYYLSEANDGPVGLIVDLKMYDKEQFLGEAKRLNAIKIDVRPIIENKT